MNLWGGKDKKGIHKRKTGVATGRKRSCCKKNVKIVRQIIRKEGPEKSYAEDGRKQC